jgi:UPF0755 protein
MKRSLLTILALLLLAALGGAWFVWQQITWAGEPFRGFSGGDQFVEIPSGTGPQAIGRMLVDAGVVHDAISWRIALARTGEATRLKAGEYRFVEPATPAQVIARLVRGDVYLRSVTFREGLTIRQMADIYARAGLGQAAGFIEAAGQGDLVRALDPAAVTLEGYLFPDTYALPRRASADDLVRMMVTRFERAWSGDLGRDAERSGFSVREAVTLASIVEKETGRADERPLVAAVYRNRLRKRMGLQCDPTVIYALELRGGFNGNLTRADLAVDSPYNTYKYAGLPPGPIAAPGKASLEAALRPAQVDYLYFVSRNDGSHAFAATLDEHNRNVHQYQVAYFRQRKAAGTRD